jgi:hypothetical protein
VFGRGKQKTHRPVSLAVGFCQPLKLFVSQLTRHPPPDDTRIRVDVMLIDVIRLAFWVVAFMVAVRELDLVVLFPAQSRIRFLRFEFFKELHQPINQSAPASDDVESALMLMLFQDLVQSTFQFFHTAPPQLGSSYVDNRE